MFLEFRRSAGNDGDISGVLGVHVDDLVGGGNFAFQKAVQWLRTELECGTWEQSRFRFRGRELSQEKIANPTRSLCRSLFKIWSPLLFPNM